MKKYIVSLLFISILTISCNTTTPEKYFDVAVLNVNMLNGFAGDGQLRELASPSVTMVEGREEPVQMKRKEVIDSKIKFLDEAFAKLMDLKETAETRDILRSSIALYDYALPVYKTEYVQLAELYDAGGSKELIEAKAISIHDKHAAKFGALYDKLISDGKVYAAKNSINVKWDVQTSPN